MHRASCPVPLAWSVSNGRLKAAGEQRAPPRFCHYGDERGEHGQTPLLVASRAGRAEVVAALLAGGAMVNLADSVGNTPLIVAGNAETAKVLIEAKAAVVAKNKAGSTALHTAAKQGRLEVVR